MEGQVLTIETVWPGFPSIEGSAVGLLTENRDCPNGQHSANE